MKIISNYYTTIIFFSVVTTVLFLNSCEVNSEDDYKKKMPMIQSDSINQPPENQRFLSWFFKSKFRGYSQYGR